MNRREMLAGLGVASASLILACKAPTVAVHTQIAPGESIRGWLRDAVTVLAPSYASVQAFAVSRRRMTAAIDGLGVAVSRARFEGVVIAVRDKAGLREQIASEVTQASIARIVIALTGASKSVAKLSFGGGPRSVLPKLASDPRTLDDRALLSHVGGTDIATSRIIYAANLLDIDDVTRWSVAADHDREERSVRVRRTATRVAWNGVRPVVGETTLAWAGGVDDHLFTLADLHATTTAATELMTPGAFADGEHDLLLDPSVTAAMIDAIARTLYTAAAQHRPEVAKHAALALALVDDPTVRGTYGGYAFDDAGVAAAPIALPGVLGAGRERRPGGLGRLVAMPSHLRLAEGRDDADKMLEAGFVLEGGGRVAIDPGSDRITIAAARAREIAKGTTTGQVFADVEVVGSLTALLASASGTSNASRTFGIREEIDGEPTWRSIEAPALRCRGVVRARRIPR